MTGSSPPCRKGAVLLLISLILAACTPATAPEHLAFTPGAPVTVTRSTFTGAGFSLQYPDDWRIITGQADLPQTATFVSPDNCAIILVAAASVEPILSPDCPDADFQTTTREIALNTVTLTLAGSAPAQQWEKFLESFEQVAASVQGSSPAALPHSTFLQLLGVTQLKKDS